jgi:hypothetical protein
MESSVYVVKTYMFFATSFFTKLNFTKKVAIDHKINVYL